MNTETKQNVIISKNIDNEHRRLKDEIKDTQDAIKNFNTEIKRLGKELKSIKSIKGLSKELMDKKKAIVAELMKKDNILKENRDKLVKNLNNVRLELNTEKGDTPQHLKHVLSMSIKDRSKVAQNMVKEFKSQYNTSYFDRLYKYFSGNKSKGTRSKGTRSKVTSNKQNTTPETTLILNGKETTIPKTMSIQTGVNNQATADTTKNNPLRRFYNNMRRQNTTNRPVKKGGPIRLSSTIKNNKNNKNTGNNTVKFNSARSNSARSNSSRNDIKYHDFIHNW